MQQTLKAAWAEVRLNSPVLQIKGFDVGTMRLLLLLQPQGAAAAVIRSLDHIAAAQTHSVQRCARHINTHTNVFTVTRLRQHCSLCAERVNTVTISSPAK